LKEKGVQMANLNLPDNQDDIDEAFNLLFRELAKEERKVKISQTSKDDYFKSFRTNLVLSWILSNLLLVGMCTTSQIFTLLKIEISPKFNAFVSFFLWSVASISIFRLVGSILYKFRYKGEIV
jgi:chitin synthase